MTIEANCMRTEYEPVITALTPILQNLPGKIIGIDGYPYTGKTTLGRCLACMFNVSLIETDLFLKDEERPFQYEKEMIRNIIDRRLSIPRPVIVEGVRVIKILDDVGFKPDFLILLFSRNSQCPEWVRSHLENYFSAYQRLKLPDVTLEMPID